MLQEFCIPGRAPPRAPSRPRRSASARRTSETPWLPLLSRLSLEAEKMAGKGAQNTTAVANTRGVEGRAAGPFPTETGPVSAPPAPGPPSLFSAGAGGGDDQDQE